MLWSSLFSTPPTDNGEAFSTRAATNNRYLVFSGPFENLKGSLDTKGVHDNISVPETISGTEMNFSISIFGQVSKEKKLFDNLIEFLFQK